MRIMGALKNLKTLMTTKKLEINSNAFKLLLFERADIDEIHESVQIVKSENSST